MSAALMPSSCAARGATAASARMPSVASAWVEVVRARTGTTGRGEAFKVADYHSKHGEVEQAVAEAPRHRSLRAQGEGAGLPLARGVQAARAGREGTFPEAGRDGGGPRGGARRLVAGRGAEGRREREGDRD